jgi:hypothetical protein
MPLLRCQGCGGRQGARGLCCLCTWGVSYLYVLFLLHEMPEKGCHRPRT